MTVYLMSMTMTGALLWAAWQLWDVTQAQREEARVSVRNDDVRNGR